MVSWNRTYTSPSEVQFLTPLSSLSEQWWHCYNWTSSMWNDTHGSSLANHTLSISYCQAQWQLKDSKVTRASTVIRTSLQHCNENNIALPRGELQRGHITQRSEHLNSHSFTVGTGSAHKWLGVIKTGSDEGQQESVWTWDRRGHLPLSMDMCYILLKHCKNLF
jgi:hypothetical protein